MGKKLRSAEKGGNFDPRVDRDVVSSAKESERNGGRQGLQGVQELEGNIPIKEMRTTDYAEKVIYMGDKKVKKAIEMGIEKRLD